MLAISEPSGDAWVWVAGILALANAAQFYINGKERAQNRTDLLTVVPVLAEVKAILADVRELVK